MTSARRKRGKDEQSDANDAAGSAQVADFPKEVKILGKISRVYIEGNDLYQKLVFEEIDPKEKKTEEKKYVIVPIKDKNSVVQFIKVPIFKLRKKPRAKNIGVVKCERINPGGVEPLTEDLYKWSAEKDEFGGMEKTVVSCGTSPGGVHPVCEAPATAPVPQSPPSSPSPTPSETPSLLSPLSDTPPPSPPAKTPPPTPPPPAKTPPSTPPPPAKALPPPSSSPSSPVVQKKEPDEKRENEPYRLLSYLITVKEKKSKGRRSSKKQ